MRLLLFILLPLFLWGQTFDFDYDFSDVVVTSSPDIDSVRDGSGSFQRLYQNTADAKPHVVVDADAGSGAKFDGSNDQMYMDNWPGTFGSAQTGWRTHIVIRFRGNLATTNTDIITDSTDSRSLIIIGNPGDRVIWRSEQNNVQTMNTSTAGAGTYNDTLKQDSLYLITLGWNYVAGPGEQEAYLWINGEFADSLIENVSQQWEFNRVGLRTGGNPLNADFFRWQLDTTWTWPGDSAEIVQHDYELCQKYGITYLGDYVPPSTEQRKPVLNKLNSLKGLKP